MRYALGFLFLFLVLLGFTLQRGSAYTAAEDRPYELEETAAEAP